MRTYLSPNIIRMNKSRRVGWAFKEEEEEEEMGWGMGWTGLICRRIGSSVGFCKNGGEPSGWMKFSSS
jgi:hypothetical protein